MKENDVKYFNSFDLYSKIDSLEITDDIKKYYDNLLDQYFPNDLKW